MAKSSRDPVELAPHSKEAEEALLGGLLIAPDLLPYISFLKPERFFFKRNEMIFAAMLRLKERGDVVDYLTVIEELRTHGQLDLCGGPPYLTYVVSYVGSTAGLETYAEIVQRTGMRRRVLDVATALTQAAMNEAISVSEAMSEVRREVLALEQDYDHAARRLPSVEDQIAETKRRTFAAKDGLVQLSPGQLHDWLGYITPGETLLVVGQQGFGKTRFMLQQAWHNAVLCHKRGAGRVLFTTIESDVTQVHWTLVTMLNRTGITYVKLLTGNLTPEQRADYETILENIGRLPLDIVDVGGWTAEDVVSLVRGRGDYVLVINDYPQKLAASPLGRDVPGYLEMGHRYEVFAECVKQAEIVGLLASQKNRDGEGTRAIALSDRIADRPTLIFDLSRDVDKDEVTLFLSKDRMRGKMYHALELHFSPVNGTYENAEKVELNR